MRKGYLSEIFVSFQGEGAHLGRRHLFIRMAGCNLRCRYCDTPASLERVAAFSVQMATDGRELVANPVTPGELAQLVKGVIGTEAALDGAALTGGEPLLQADFLAELLSTTPVPRPCLLETSGMLPDHLPVLLPLVDVISMDIKLPSNTGEAAFWQEHGRFLRLAREKVYVKILVDRHTAIEDVTTAAELVESEASHAAVFLQPITNVTGSIDIDEDSLRSFYIAARQHLADVRVVPQTHKFLGVP